MHYGLFENGEYYLPVTIIPLVFVGYKMIIANSALRALLAVYHLTSNEHSLKNC